MQVAEGIIPGEASWTAVITRDARNGVGKIRAFIFIEVIVRGDFYKRW